MVFRSKPALEICKCAVSISKCAEFKPISKHKTCASTGTPTTKQEGPFHAK
jgi:hypothetical protein